MRRHDRNLILNVLYPLLEDSLGIDPNERPLPGEPIDEHLKRLKVWDDVDLFDLCWRCEWVFGFRVDRADWKKLFDGGVTDVSEWERTVAPWLTHERLAEFIAERVPVVSFDPVEIAGRRCGPAGAFFGIREVAEGCLQERDRFAPSAPILGHLKRPEIERLWDRLRWMTGGCVPHLRTCWSDRIAGGTVYWTIAWVMAGSASLCLGMPDIALVFGALLAPAWALYLVLRRSDNPLPNGIVTFGDLARLIAEMRTPAASAR